MLSLIMCINGPNNSASVNQRHNNTKLLSTLKYLLFTLKLFCVLSKGFPVMIFSILILSSSSFFSLSWDTTHRNRLYEIILRKVLLDKFTYLFIKLNVFIYYLLVLGLHNQLFFWFSRPPSPSQFPVSSYVELILIFLEP